MKHLGKTSPLRGPEGEILPGSIAENVTRHQLYGWRGEENPMNNSRHSDPEERSALMRLFYRN